MTTGLYHFEKALHAFLAPVVGPCARPCHREYKDCIDGIMRPDGLLACDTARLHEVLRSVGWQLLLPLASSEGLPPQSFDHTRFPHSSDLDLPDRTTHVFISFVCAASLIAKYIHSFHFVVLGDHKAAKLYIFCVMLGSIAQL